MKSRAPAASIPRVCGHGIGGEHHHGDVPGARIHGKAGQHVAAMTVGEMQIEEDQIGAVLAGHFQPGRAGLGAEQPDRRAPREDAGDQLHLEGLSSM